MYTDLILRSPAERSEDGRLEGWQRAVCQMVRDAPRRRKSDADVLLTMRELGVAAGMS